MQGVFSQVAVMGSSGMLLCALILLWRRGVEAYISAFMWQSVVLGALTAAVGYFGDDPQLYVVAVLLFAIKAVAIPKLLRRVAQRFTASRESAPYVNTATSLVVSGLLVLLAHAATRPLEAIADVPTRAGMPLAMGLLTGKYRAGVRPSIDDVRGEKSPEWMKYFKDVKPNPEWAAKRDAIREILTSNGRTVAQGALAWNWGRSPQTIPIPGFRTVKQVEENSAAMEFGPLTAEQMAQINIILGRD